MSVGGHAGRRIGCPKRRHRRLVSPPAPGVRRHGPHRRRGPRAESDDPSELRRIRTALLRQTDQAGLGSGVASRAFAAVQGLDQLLALGPDQLSMLTLNDDELKLAVRLQSCRPEDREWRRSLGAKARRLDAGESASITIAATRSLGFAIDDQDALSVCGALTGTPGRRTRDLLRQLVTDGVVDEHDAKAVHLLLQSDDLHNLGGPAR